MTALHAPEEPTTDRWSALGGVLLSALYLWVMLWLLLAVVLPSVGFGWHPVVITSGSMQPLIRPGDVVLTGMADEVLPGQVVTYADPAREGSLTTHRIVSVTETGDLRTQGDANPTPDSTVVPSENLVGRGRLLVPMIGLPLLWLSGGAVLFGLWVIVTAISVAVVAGGTARGGGTGGSGGGRAPASVRTVLGPLARMRPRAVQRTIVGALVRIVDRVHDAVYRGYRPNPSRVRRAAPSVAVLALILGLARTPAGVAVGLAGLVLVLLYDPDGPQFRVERMERAGRRLRRTAGALVPSGAAGRAIVAVAVLVAVGAPTLGRSAAVFSAAASTTGSTFTAATAFPTSDTVLWLQNDPEGQDTVDQTFQPMSTTEPTQTTLPNYDTNDDAAPGLRIAKGATTPYTSDNQKVQRWRYAVPADITVAAAEVVFHAAAKDFAQGKTATTTWYLGYCRPGYTQCVQLGASTVTAADWQAGASGFVERTAAFGSMSHVVPAGWELVIVATVPSGDTDLWFAYDTANQPSRLVLTPPSSGTCPGTGSTQQGVRADTRVEQDHPTSNFSTNVELDAKSHAGANRRSLLAVDLPVIPAGCSLTSATLHLTTRTSQTGRVLAVQRTDAAFDTATVTWATQPTASGAIGTGPSTGNGPTPINVTGPIGDLYTFGNTGLQLRDSVEDAPSNQDNRFHSTESRPWPDAEGPRLEVTWGP